jgi:hypothetical protein
MNSISPVVANRLFGAIVLIIVIQATINPFRLLSVFNTSYINLFFVYLFGAFALWNVIKHGVSFYVIEWVLIFLIIFGAFYGIIINNETFKIFTDVIKPIFFISVIKVFRSFFIYYPSVNVLKKIKINFIAFSYVVGVSIVAFFLFQYWWYSGFSFCFSTCVAFFLFFLQQKLFIMFGSIFIIPYWG